MKILDSDVKKYQIWRDRLIQQIQTKSLFSLESRLIRGQGANLPLGRGAKITDVTQSYLLIIKTEHLSAPCYADEGWQTADRHNNLNKLETKCSIHIIYIKQMFEMEFLLTTEIEGLGDTLLMPPKLCHCIQERTTELSWDVSADIFINLSHH